MTEVKKKLMVLNRVSFGVLGWNPSKEIVNLVAGCTKGGKYGMPEGATHGVFGDVVCSRCKCRYAESMPDGSLKGYRFDV